MKKIITILFILFLLTQDAFSQMKSLRYNAVKIQPKQELFLHSTSHKGGGENRMTIKIDLPKNTVKWYYSFSTALKNKPTDTKDLFGNLTNTIINGAASSNPITAIGKLILDKAMTPTGENIIDIYLTNTEGRKIFMERGMFDWKYSKPNSFPEGTREGFKSGIVEIDDIIEGTVYLGFRNPNTAEGVTFGIEVVAIVAEEVLNNTVWSAASKKYFYDFYYDFYKKRNIADDKARAISGCIVEKVMLEKTPSEYEGMNEGARTNWVQPIAQSCVEKYLPKKLEKTEQQKKGVTFCNLGWTQYENGNLDTAIEYSKKGLTFDNTLGYAKANLGLFYLIKADESTATDYYVDAISDFNNNKISAKKSFEDAVDDIDKALVKYPTMKGYKSIRDLLVLELKKYK